MKIENTEATKNENPLVTLWVSKLVNRDRADDYACRVGAYAIACAYITSDMTIEEAVTAVREDYDKEVSSNPIKSVDKSFKNARDLIPYAVSMAYVLTEKDGIVEREVDPETKKPQVRDWNEVRRCAWPSIKEAKDILHATGYSPFDAVDIWSTVEEAAIKEAKAELEVSYASKGFPDKKVTDKEIRDRIARHASENKETSTGGPAGLMDNKEKLLKQLDVLMVRDFDEIASMINWVLKKRTLVQRFMILDEGERDLIDERRKRKDK